ncbi:MAG: type II toxin-antitoxin system MqsA family antitoxin [Rhodocyclaceae bacterium]|jgi:HTH-type transcriptional regulator/antitoxin MqsA|nr:MAG: type II toxin-antitoxin system MqsA family antitoxin [Rhodocyclaceae bacterium]HNB46627.1 type II toxin-antitoxin system MqsA family antitoxin [Burkholderiaceae bacterium]
MFKCEVCGGTEVRDEVVDEVFHVDGRYVLVEHIPATVCAQCGEMTFTRDAVEAVRQRVHGAAATRSVQLEVFAY